jgi:hypothetical protein
MMAILGLDISVYLIGKKSQLKIPVDNFLNINNRSGQTQKPDCLIYAMGSQYTF